MVLRLINYEIITTETKTRGYCTKKKIATVRGESRESSFYCKMHCFLWEGEKRTFHVRINLFWPGRDGWHTGDIGWHWSVWCSRGASRDSWWGVLCKNRKAIIIKTENSQLHMLLFIIKSKYLATIPHQFHWDIYTANHWQKRVAVVSSLLENTRPITCENTTFPFNGKTRLRWTRNCSEEQEPESQTWAPMRTPTPGCATAGKPPRPSKLPLPQLQNGADRSSCLPGLLWAFIT